MADSMTETTAETRYLDHFYSSFSGAWLFYMINGCFYGLEFAIYTALHGDTYTNPGFRWPRLNKIVMSQAVILPTLFLSS